MVTVQIRLDKVKWDNFLKNIYLLTIYKTVNESILGKAHILFRKRLLNEHFIFNKTVT